MKIFIRAYTGKNTLVFFLLLTQAALAQSPGRQLVKNTKRFVCQYRDGGTAKTAEEACQHHVKVHREGYTVTKAETRDDGQVMCTCQITEDGNTTSMEEASMTGEVTCPPHSAEANTGKRFRWQEEMCECDQDYVAQGDQCVLATEARTAHQHHAPPTAAPTSTAAPAAAAGCECAASPGAASGNVLTRLPKLTPTFYPPTSRSPDSYQKVKIQNVGALLAAGKALAMDTNAVHGLGRVLRQHAAAKQANNNRLLGIAGEQAAQLLLRTLPCDSVFDGKFNTSDNGFDLLSFSPCVATPSAIRIVESKQVDRDGNITLSAANKGVQMSNEWELTTLHQLAAAPRAVNPNGPRMARAMRAHATLVEKYVAAIYNGQLVVLRLGSF